MNSEKPAQLTCQNGGICLVIGLVLMLLTYSAAAQSAGIVRGRVQNAAGVIAAGANIRLENTSRGYRRETTTNDEGRFQFSNVPFDNYKLIAAQSGFAENTQQIALRSNVPLETNVALTAADVEENPPIADNSFLIEEAYNQEAGVIQHINTFTRSRGGDWLYTFTEEIPIPNQKHQLSFTLPAQKLKGFPGGEAGIGDVAVNYRYQLVANKKTAVAPRVSVLFPTGNSRKERGAGGIGFQFNLPVSVQFSRKFVAHSNAGFTLTPRAKSVLGERARTVDYNLGQSVVWLAAPRFNVLVEAVWNNTATVTGFRQTNRENEVLINPGIRWAHNFKNGLQIVPGVAFPIGVGPSRGERGIFFYLSFEHPFKKQSK